jgi:hypothetical protein
MADAYAAGALPRPDLANMGAYLDIGSAIDHDSSEIGLSPDYHGVYRDALALRDRQRPLAVDTRLWTEIGATPATAAAVRSSRAA